MNNLRKLILKVEAIWWMSRLNFLITPILLAVTGWACTKENFDLPRLLALIGFIGLMTTITLMINDLLDQDDDAVTAPYLPLPAGLLNQKEVILAIALAFASAAALLYYASLNSIVFLIVICLTLFAFVAAGLYSQLKHTGGVASIIVSITYLTAPIIGWLLAGNRSLYIIPVLLYTLFLSFSGNILAALRDIDKDPLVGNYTLPVRIGPGRAFTLVAILDCIDSVLIGWIAFTAPHGYFSLLLLIPVAIFMGCSFHSTLRTFGESGRGREQRLADLHVWRLGKHFKSISLLCIFSLPLGMIVGGLLEGVVPFWKMGYERRIVNGELVRAYKEQSGLGI
jgi:4-hydroxybenzoate polyprenyltransferase